MGILETLIETLKEERDRRKRARITKEWFRNDIREIRKQLRDDTIGAFNTWSNNKPLDAYRVYYRTVFEKLINQLGDIGDEGLVSGTTT